jgi:hypothetical protein
VTAFIDANIPMYAAGKAHPAKQPCLALLNRVIEGEVEAATDVEVLQEILHRFSAIQRRSDGVRLFDLFSRIVPVLYGIDAHDLATTRDLMVTHPALQARDAIHLAIMSRYGIETIYSYDHQFDGLPGVRRFEP